MNSDQIVTRAVVSMKQCSLEVLNIGRCPACALRGDKGILVSEHTCAEDNFDGKVYCLWQCENCEKYVDEISEESGLICTICLQCSGFGESSGIPCANCEERGYLLAVSATDFREARPL